MKYIELEKNLEKIKIFSTNDLKFLDEKYNKSKIFNWKKLGYIKQIIRGFYILGKIEINHFLSFKIANKIYSPSYISLESVFSYYGIIPEQSFVIKSVSTKKTNTFHTDFGTYEYNKIKTKMYFGYEIKIIKNEKILIASLEKALIDYFYLNNNINSTIDLQYLRFNKYLLKEKLDINLLKKYGKSISSKVVNKRIDLLIEYINND
ncbi:MAG: hypothetical protein V3575_03075 [Candidatus Absconditabacteria bacterium]